MWKTSLVAGALLLGSAGGCAHQEPRRVERREPIVEESRADWVRLGEREVDGVRDRDVIHVGAREGSYRRIMLVVERSALEMHDIIVTFGDGERFEPQTRLIFAENTRSRIIPLPGGTRVIRSVEFRYGNLPGGGRAIAELWAQ